MKRLFEERTARILAGLCVVAIVILSLVPGDVRPHTGIFSGRVEHFIAYAGTGFFLAFGYRRKRERLLAWMGLAAASAVFEAAQHFIPGRSPSPLDALASAGGLTVGLLVAASLIDPLSRKSG